MGLRVNSNLYSTGAQRNLSNVSARLGGNFARLSSGLRIASASDDAAGLGISERMRAQVRSLQQAGRNASDGVSLVQTAEGSLNELNGNLVRMRELAIQSSNGTLNTGDRTVIQEEFAALIAEIDRVAAQTTFNGVNILDGSTTSLSIQVGTESGETIDIAFEDMQSAALGLSGVDISDVSGAQAALDLIDTAVDSVSSLRGGLGSSQNRISSTIRSIAVAAENLASAESRIRDVDIAVETADLTRNSILQQAAVSVLAQANVQPQLALSLLG
ncbi:MAG: flagellin FliC [Planctomycetes bacterium]|nr:flagellin FliC [Planctomycetota bacterium]